ncbi:hypothetical protein BJY04DRAFT_221456 [Aspergillus karnatakaensis]|uniref:uncharacterized protein n=1 Tax=Aspergillus karnatakaensis TaxID=1810916 RepID=UPI003CCE0BC0
MGNDYTEHEQAAISDGVTSDIPLNRWPDEVLSEFRTAIYDYCKEVRAFSQRLVGIFAPALGLDEHALEHIHRSDSYRPVMIAHSDHDAFTCLLQSEVGGFEVLKVNAVWVPVPLREHAFSMDTGSHFELVSNGPWKATVHRVSWRVSKYSAARCRPLLTPLFWSFGPCTVVVPLERLHGETNLEPELAGQEFAEGTFSTKPDHPVVAEMKMRDLVFEDYFYADLLHGKDPWMKE